MRNLRFVVNGQEIKKSPDCDFSGLVSGTKGYLKAVFALSSDFNGCGVVAIFNSIKSGEKAVTLPIGKNECMIPDEVLTGSEFSVRLIGAKKDFQITTNKCVVEQERVRT